MDERKTLNEELNISSYLLAEGHSAENVSGFRGSMSIPQTTANIATLASEEYRDKVKKLVVENGADFDDAPVYISPSMRQFDVYNVGDSKLLQQINSTGNTMQDMYQGKVICTSSHMAFIENKEAELPIKSFFDYGVRCTRPSSCSVIGYISNNARLRSILGELKVVADEGLVPIGCNDDDEDEVTATKLCEKNKRRLLLGLEPDESAIGTSNLIFGELHHYLTNKAMTPENTQVVVELVKSRSHHDMETGVVVVIDTMPELPSLDLFDGDVMCEVCDDDSKYDKPLIPWESTRSGKAKKFAVRGGKMVPTGQYPKFMTNPKHNKKQRKKK